MMPIRCDMRGCYSSPTERRERNLAAVSELGQYGKPQPKSRSVWSAGSLLPLSYVKGGRKREQAPRTPYAGARELPHRILRARATWKITAPRPARSPLAEPHLFSQPAARD